MWFLICFIFLPSRTSLTFLPAVDGVGEEEEAGAWLRRCWSVSTEEEEDEEGGQIDERRGRGEGSIDGGSKVDAASAVASPSSGLCVVRGGGKGREEKG
jgi:hypothetical protein